VQGATDAAPACLFSCQPVMTADHPPTQSRSCIHTYVRTYIRPPHARLSGIKLHAEAYQRRDLCLDHRLNCLTMSCPRYVLCAVKLIGRRPPPSNCDSGGGVNLLIASTTPRLKPTLTHWSPLAVAAAQKGSHPTLVAADFVPRRNCMQGPTAASEKSSAPAPPQP
jgi:hypothetical protein